MKVISLLFLILISISLSLPKLTKEKISETLIYETYNVNQDESIGVLGFSYHRHLNDKLYWGGSGYGAVTGGRGGYFIGGFTLGYIAPILKEVFIDSNVFIGGGGGHGAPQGGGEIIHPSIGLGINLSDSLNIALNYGYIWFVNGQINSPSLGISMSWKSYELY